MMYNLQFLILRGRDGGFGFSVTGAGPVLVCSVQPSKSILHFRKLREGSNGYCHFLNLPF